MCQSPKRIQRKRTKGWCMPPNAVYVGRPTIFGNPFNNAESFGRWLSSGEIALSCLRDKHWFPWTPESKRRLSVLRNAILEHVGTLRDHDLACWCPLECECHADILLEFANS